jgi:CRP/FNR family cyclic AMP-dependent transcriptional regulator
VFSPNRIIFTWLLINLAIIVLVLLMPVILGDRKKPVQQLSAHPQLQLAGAPEQEGSYIRSITEGFGYTVRSGYLRWITLGVMLLAIIFAMIEYRSSGLLLNALGSQESLNNYLALLLGLGNVIVLPMLLFGLNRLIARLGLGNASLIFPTGNLLINSSLMLAPGLASATAAYFNYTTLPTSFYYPINTLLYNAVPLRVRGRARAFVDGLIFPIGLLAGSALLLVLPINVKIRAVTLFIGLLALAFFITSVIIRRQYGRALVQMLEQENYTFLLSHGASDLAAADPATLNRLRVKLESSESHEITVFMTQLIAQIGGRQALSILAPAVRKTAEPRTRAAMVDTMSAAGLSGNVFRDLCIFLLADPDGRVRRSAIASLEQLTGTNDQWFQRRMLAMTSDIDLEVRSRVLSALIRGGDFYKLEPAVRALDELLNDEDPHKRVYGVRVLKRINQPRAAFELLKYLEDREDRVRLEAALAMEDYVCNSRPASMKGDDGLEAQVLSIMSLLIQDPIERVRQAALTVFGQIGNDQAQELLLEALSDSSFQIRETAISALVRMGEAIIPVLKSRLESPEAQVGKTALVVLGRIQPAEFAQVVMDTGVKRNLQQIYQGYNLVEALETCRDMRSIHILQCALRERCQDLAYEILYFLASIHDMDAVKIIGDSLGSGNSRVRANAAEALEAMTSPHTAGLITPLFEPGPPAKQLAEMGRNIWGLEPIDATQAIHQLVNASETPWIQALANFSLGEIGSRLRGFSFGIEAESQEIVSQQPFEEKSTYPRRRSRRALGKELLGEELLSALEDSDEQEATKSSQEEFPATRLRKYSPTDLLGVISGDADIEDGLRSIEEKGESGSDTPETHKTLEERYHLSFTIEEIETLLRAGVKHPVKDVRLAARTASKSIVGVRRGSATEETMLSTIDRIIFLKEVPFFQDMTIDQLRVLANVCEEQMFDKDTRIFNNGDPGGTLYVVVNGRVGIEQEKRTGSFARLANVEAYSYFGEANFFDNSPCSTSAVAIQDTLTLKLHREPLIALARQNPDLSLELINVLSQRLREVNDRLADMTRSKPRALHQLYDQFD